MATKREEFQNPSSCLMKAGDDEPLFVLRANDPMAPLIVREWVAFSHQRGLHQEKLVEALNLANRMETWRMAKDALKVTT